MKELDKDSLFIECDCNTEGLLISDEIEEFCNSVKNQQFYIALYNHGNQGSKMGWRRRLSLIWQILTEGTSYKDQICMSHEKARKLAKHLQYRCKTGINKGVKNED